jgi:predicted transcriptional regulator
MVMVDDKKEMEHIASVLRQTKKALKDSDSLLLQQLSDQTIHSATIHQHTDFITIAVLIYALNKMVAHRDKIKIKRWDALMLKLSNEIDNSLVELEKRDVEEFARHLEHIRDLLIDFSPSARQDIQEVLRKAEVNKATKIYEHGISLTKTAHLLGITQWELVDYIGQKSIFDNPLNATIEVKKRAKMAEDFFK